MNFCYVPQQHGTTAERKWYYRGRRGCKKLHPPLLPRGSGTSLVGNGSAAPGKWYYRAAAWYYRWCLRYYRSLGSSTTASQRSSQKQGDEKAEDAPRERRGQEGDVYVMIPPKPFRRGPPINSTAFLRLKSTKKKHRKDVVFNSLRGAPNRLVPSDEMSRILKAHD